MSIRKLTCASRAMLALCCLLAVALAQCARAAGDRAYTPKPGSAERKAIMDALRPPVSRYVKKRVTFTEVKLFVCKGWAYMEATTVDSKGKKVGTELTTYVTALLRKTSGKWRPLEWAYATDVAAIEWEKKYPRAPRVIWPQHRQGAVG